jgi:hypothetical protein
MAGMGEGQQVKRAQPNASTAAASINFGDSASGQIVLNLAGACPYFNGIEERTSINIDELTAYMDTRLTYTYELAARRGYSAIYNLSALLSRIENKAKRGGLFSTMNINALIDEANSNDWFNIQFNGNTGEYQYTQDEQNIIKKDIKREIADKAMRQFSILNAGSASPASTPDFLETGAGIAAQELRKCWHFYCQASSAVLGIANGLWGHSQATANFHKNNSSWVTEHVRGLQFVDRTSSVAFKRR